MPIPNNETRFFQLQIRTGSLTGPVQITSNVITVVDGAQAFVNATGGMVYIDNGFKTHVFTESNNFVISGLGLPANRNLYYEIVAGGGAGGYNNSQGSGGGGAGGYLRGNVTLSTTGTFAMTVGGGAGGLYSGGYVAGGRGSNSSIFGNTYVAVGGGNGATPSPSSGTPGGSGGGADFYSTTVGTGISGQGNPGGGDNSSSRGGGGGGAGEAGTGYPAGARGGNGLSSVAITGIPSLAQPLYGTPSYGPQSGRWFAGGGQGARGGPIAQSGPNASGLHSAGGGGRAGEPGIASGNPGMTNTGGGGGAGDSGPGSGAGGSGIVIVRYPYTIQTYNLTDSIGFSKVILENSNVDYTLSTVNVSNATILYWTLSGNVLNGDVVGGNTGSFAVVNANASLRINIANSIVTGNDTKNYALQLRTGSASGPIVATSNTIAIYASTTRGNFITATGGNLFIGGGYKTHIFTDSNSFIVSDIGRMGGIIEYMSIAGGGGNGNNALNTGGGGAGGALYGVTTVSPGTYTLTLGAGGAAGSAGTGGSNGGNTSVSGPTTMFGVTVGGGAAGQMRSDTYLAKTGGSGGGAGGGGNGAPFNGAPGYGYPGVAGVTQQGYPGTGSYYASEPYAYSGPGGGAGGFGGAYAGRGGIGIVSPMSPTIPGFFGTSGPAPGRYFAGGGAGGRADGYQSGEIGTGGYGGGGDQGFNGNVNTGGGAGQIWYVPGNPQRPYQGGRQGGSGIVIIRYPFV